MYVYGYDMLQISYRDDDVARLLGHIRTDFDRHLARVESV